MIDLSNPPASWSPSGAAVQSGIDLSQSWTVDGVSHPALPGMYAGYFSGSKPNMGAIQDGASPPPPAPTPSPTPADAQAPVISNVKTTINNSSSVTIYWDLNEPGTGQIEYGLTTAYGSTSNPELTFEFSSHWQDLTGLTAGETYHFRIRSQDKAGNLAVSDDFTFLIPSFEGLPLGPYAIGDGVNYHRAATCAEGTVATGGSCDCGSSSPVTLNYMSDPRTWYCGCTAPSPVSYVVARVSCTASATPAPSPSPTPADAQAPIISNVKSSVNSSGTVTISWDLNEPGTGQIEYGPTTSYGSSSAPESSFDYTSHSQDLLGLTAGVTYHFRVKSQDQAGNLAVSGDFTFTVGTAPAPSPTPAPSPSPSPIAPQGPVISNVSASVSGENLVFISWDLNEPGTGQVEYGVTTSYGSLSELESSFNYSSHSQQIAGLQAGTTYHFRIRSQNQAGVLSISQDYQFTTAGTPPMGTISGDTIPPTVTLTSPSNGSVVSAKSSVTLTASASDAVDVTRVEFYVNGALQCTDATSAYSCAWKVPGGRNKSYRIQAKAFDSAGNAGSSAAVTVRSQ
jgi:hypothetical protein